MEKQYALCSNKTCHMRLMCLRYFVFKSEMYDATDEVMDFEPNDEGECEHFLSFLQENEMDNEYESDN